MSATRTQARMDNLAVGLVAAGSPLRLPFEGKARMAPYGCSAVNWPEMSSTRAGRPRQSRERQIKEAFSLVAPLALYDDARLLELPRGDQATLTSASVSAPMAPSFFLAVSAARRAAHTGQEADGITATQPEDGAFFLHRIVLEGLRGEDSIAISCPQRCLPIALLMSSSYLSSTHHFALNSVI
jgi:hypothetical protein